jgi:hypothetical protein
MDARCDPEGFVWKSVRKSVWGCLAVFAVWARVAAPARAALVTWQFDGHVRDVLTFAQEYNTHVDDPALTSLGVVSGVPFIATVVVESSTPSTGHALLGYYVPGVVAVDYLCAGYHVGGAMTSLQPPSRSSRLSAW